jgi:TolB-like protein
MKKVVFYTSLIISLIYTDYLYSDEYKLKLNVGNLITGESKSKNLEKDTSRNLPTLLVFDMTTEKSVDKGIANLLVEIIMEEISKTEKFDVIGQKDIDKMLFWETSKSLKNCNDSTCLMQIAGAMGAEYYVESSIGQLGDSYIISMKLIDTMTIKIKGRSTRAIQNNENMLISNVRDMTYDMLIMAKFIDKKPAYLDKIFSIDERVAMPVVKPEGQKEVQKPEKVKEEIVINREIQTTKVDEGLKWYNNKWVWIGTGVGLAVVSGAIIYFYYYNDVKDNDKFVLRFTIP